VFDAPHDGVSRAIVSLTEVQRVRSDAVIQEVSHGRRVHGAMLSVCTAPGCTALTMGGTCVAHDAPVTVVFPRGRPYRSQCVASPEVVRVGSILQAPVT
jgi:hypothetical protein